MMLMCFFRNNSIDFKNWLNCSFLFNHSNGAMCSYTFSHSSFQFVPNNQGPETVINQGPETVILHILNPEEEDEMLQKLNCPKPADIIGIVIGIIGAIVGIGK